MADGAAGNMGTIDQRNPFAGQLPFVITEATVWALIQDAPVGWRLATLPPIVLSALFVTLASGEIIPARKRTYRQLALLFGVTYVAVAAYALVYWFGFPFSLWPFIRGGIVGVLASLFLAGLIVSIREFQAGRISGAFCYFLCGLELVLVLGLVTGFWLVRSIRTDLDHFAMPRHLEPDKAALITQYLLKFPAHTITVCNANFNDSEADDYTSQISKALVDGKWTVNSCDHNLIDIMPDFYKSLDNTPNAPVTYTQLRSFMTEMFTESQWKCEGLVLQVQRSQKLVQQMGARTRQDPANPDIDVLITDALKQGGIYLGGGICGMSPALGTKDEMATLTVGFRPRTWHPRMIFPSPVPAE
jgi:hypothetical protein